MKFRSGVWIWRINFTSFDLCSIGIGFYRNYIEGLCLIDKIVDAVRHPISIILPSRGLKVIDEKYSTDRPLFKNFPTSFKFYL